MLHSNSAESLVTEPTSTTKTPNNDGGIRSGLLWHCIGKREVLESWVLHMCVHQYSVILHGVGVIYIGVDLEEERRACGSITLGGLVK